MAPRRLDFTKQGSSIRGTVRSSRGVPAWNSSPGKAKVDSGLACFAPATTPLPLLAMAQISKEHSLKLDEDTHILRYAAQQCSQMVR